MHLTTRLQPECMQQHPSNDGGQSPTWPFQWCTKHPQGPVLGCQEEGMGGCLVGQEGGSICWAGISTQPQKSTDVDGIWVWWAPKWCTNQLERSPLRADGWRGLPRQWARQAAASKSGVESRVQEHGSAGSAGLR